MWPWKSESSQKSVTTYMPNALALKIDCAKAYNRILNSTVWISKWWNENLVMLITFERVNVREDYRKGVKWFSLKWSLVQILVTVAIIQIKNLKIEAEKGFRRTLFEPELVDPNLEINFENRFKGSWFISYNCNFELIQKKGKYFKLYYTCV